MKIALWSDLHLEFQDDFPKWKNPGADVLILGGDICLAEDLRKNPLPEMEDRPNMQKNWRGFDARRYRKFFNHVNLEFDQVFYVMGNHEHYDGRWERTEQVLRDEMSNYSNIEFMEQTKIVRDDVVFLGASLWTDMNKEDPLTMLSARDFMNDYKAIANHSTGQYRKLSPADTVRKHRDTLGWLKIMLEEDKRKTVVIGHHAPSWQSIHKAYAQQALMNGAFVSNLDDFILDREHIVLWTHGHVHNEFDYMIGNTRVVCNPHGYPGEFNLFDPAKVIEV